MPPRRAIAELFATREGSIVRRIQRIREYQLESHLGSGAAGEVWRCTHMLLQLPRALKIIHPQLAEHEEFRVRIRREARALAQLSHAHIVKAHDYFEEKNCTCIVMSYVGGGSLAERIARESPLSVAEAVRISSQVLEALDFVHQQGVIHRDIKPSNILLDESGNAYLVDFGIAKVVGEVGLTRTSTFMGTAHYVSPEQAVGTLRVDHRADEYSFACVLYEMLTGQPPFASSEAARSEYSLIHAHATERPRPPRELNAEVSPQLSDVVMRALEKNPDRRFAGCAEMRRALRASAGVDDPTDSPASPRPHASANPGSALTGAALLLALVLGVSVVVMGGRLSALHKQLAELQQLAQSWKISPDPAPPVPQPSAPAPEPPRPPAPVVPKPGPDPAAVAELLRAARIAAEAKHWTTPEGKNAYEYYSKVMAMDPGNADATSGIRQIAVEYAELASRQLARQQVDAARQSLAKGNEIFSGAGELSEPEVQLARLDFDRGNREGGAALVERAAGRNHAEALYLRGQLQQEAGKLSEALGSYEQAARQSNLGALNAAAWILATAKDQKLRDGVRAVGLAERAVKMERTSFYLDTLAAAYAEAGRLFDAATVQKEALNKLAANDPLRYEVDVHYGVLNRGEPVRSIGVTPPFRVEQLTLRNTDRSLTPLGAPGVAFAKADLRYLSMMVKTSGKPEKIVVQYLYDGKVLRSGDSPTGATTTLSFGDGSETTQGGWGSSTGGAFGAGSYAVRLWWKDQIVATGEFMVTP